MRSQLLLALMCVGPLALAPSMTPAAVVRDAAMAEPDFEALAATHAPTIVTIKFVLKISVGGMGEQENETETFGVMVDSKGLVMVSNTTLGGFGGMMRRFRGTEVSIKPTNIKVLVGDDTVGVDAKLIARDTELDLAWVRIEKPSDKGYAALDLKVGAELKLGEKFFVVSREGKFFDRVASVQEGRVAAVAKKPRHLFLPGSELGMPVFNSAGKIVGISVLQMPSGDENEGGMSMFGGSSGGPAILPVAEIVTATERALKTADENGGSVPEEEPAKGTEEGKEMGDDK